MAIIKSKHWLLVFSGRYAVSVISHRGKQCVLIRFERCYPNSTVGFTWTKPCYVPALLLLKNNNLGI